MNAHRMDQETVERLLVGPVTHPQDGPEPLVRLLTAVRAAAHPAELRGESAAMQAFRRARAGAPLPAPARTGALARLVGLKVALAALAVAATGGVALAAATGTLPGPLHRDGPGTAPSAAPHGGPSPTAGPGRSAPPSTVESGQSSPAASILRLCRSYQAGAVDNPGRTLDNPIFSDLIATAGGREKVAGYCERLDRGTGAPGASTTDRPGPAPTDRPSGRPSHASTTATPAGKPTAPAPAQTDPPGPGTR